MSDRMRTTDALERCWSSLDALFAGLDEEQWQAATLCPGWSVRDVCAHLGGIEHMLTDWFPESAETPLPFARIGEFLTETAALDSTALLARYRALIERRRGQLGALSDLEWDMPSMTPVGPGTYGGFMAIRVFDFWVHEHNVRSPLALPGHDTGPAAEMALDQVQGSLGYIVGKLIALPDGMSITFSLTGPVVREMHVQVSGRARVVPQLADADVVVTADSLTFMQLACGRIDPQEQIAAGRISWTGSTEWGERAARNLRFTM